MTHQGMEENECRKAHGKFVSIVYSPNASGVISRTGGDVLAFEIKAQDTMIVPIQGLYDLTSLEIPYLDS